MITDPAVVAAKWQARLAASTQAVTDGVNAVQQAPGAKAAAQADVWLANLQRSRDKFIRNVSAVSLQQWKDAMVSKGIPRIGPGAAAAQPKMQAFMQQWLPYEKMGMDALSSMPRGTIDQNIARAVQMIRHNAGFVYTRR